MAAVQSWPVLIRLPATAPWAAASRSASSKTTNGALPPSSRWTRLAVPRPPPAPSARPRGAGEGDHADVGMAQQRWPGGRTGAGDDVDDPVGQAGLLATSANIRRSAG